MKKVVLLAGCLSLLAVGIIGISCSKDKDEAEAKNGCKCTETYEGDTDTYTYDLAEMKEIYKASTCSQLASNVNRMDYDGDASVNCTNQ